MKINYPPLNFSLNPFQILEIDPPFSPLSLSSQIFSEIFVFSFINGFLISWIDKFIEVGVWRAYAHLQLAFKFLGFDLISPGLRIKGCLCYRHREILDHVSCSWCLGQLFFSSSCPKLLVISSTFIFLPSSPTISNQSQCFALFSPKLQRLPDSKPLSEC